jgi:putative Ca2+/H+ antiporter (TMEM165/GDT1 family)
MDLAVFATAFALIFAVELPDKTFVATIVLATRFPHFAVWAGVSAAFFVQTLVAILAGGLVQLAPHRLVLGISAAMFAAGAWLLWRNSGDADEPEQIEQMEQEEEEEIERRAGVPKTGLRAAAACFVVLFAAEWGDLSQLLTITLIARYHDPIAVGLGAFLALSTVTAIGVVVGRTLTRFVRLSVIRRVGGGVCAVLAVVAAVEASGAV